MLRASGHNHASTRLLLPRSACTKPHDCIGDEGATSRIAAPVIASAGERSSVARGSPDGHVAVAMAPPVDELVIALVAKRSRVPPRSDDPALPKDSSELESVLDGSDGADQEPPDRSAAGPARSEFTGTATKAGSTDPAMPTHLLQVVRPPDGMVHPRERQPRVHPTALSMPWRGSVRHPPTNCDSEKQAHGLPPAAVLERRGLRVSPGAGSSRRPPQRLH